MSSYIIDELPRQRGEVIRKRVADTGDLHFRFVIGAFERRVTREKLVGENAHAPVVHVVLILLMTDDFRREIVQRTASGGVPERVGPSVVSLLKNATRPAYIVSAWRIFVDQPKSASFKLPQQSTRMFSGLRSR